MSEAWFGKADRIGLIRANQIESGRACSMIHVIRPSQPQTTRIKRIDVDLIRHESDPIRFTDQTQSATVDNLKMTPKKGNSEDNGWQHETVLGSRHNYKCNYYGYTGQAGGVSRLKKHLIYYRDASWRRVSSRDGSGSRDSPCIIHARGQAGEIYEKLWFSGRLEDEKKVLTLFLPHSENATAEGDATIDASTKADATSVYRGALGDRDTRAQYALFGHGEVLRGFPGVFGRGSLRFVMFSPRGVRVEWEKRHGIAVLPVLRGGGEHEMLVCRVHVVNAPYRAVAFWRRHRPMSRPQPSGLNVHGICDMIIRLLLFDVFSNIVWCISTCGALGARVYEASVLVT
ncbi:hypothetical protein Taro_041537 [Colocasia esculenta]|uniref:Uncharacterized protein n=1 Tax=Colocasia esculenta TaxID=4460 RepID=A0A843WLQ4_COLES|nr:hypothetical protein [Colocasia esculenta]